MWAGGWPTLRAVVPSLATGQAVSQVGGLHISAASAAPGGVNLAEDLDTGTRTSERHLPGKPSSLESAIGVRTQSTEAPRAR